MFNKTSKICPHFSSGWKQSPRGIVIHYTASGTSTGDIDWFLNPDSKVSAHYYIDREGKITEIVSPINRSWHAGVSNWGGISGCNNFTFGIELDNIGKQKDGKFEPYPEAQINALIEVIKYLKTKYPLLVDSWIVGHSHVSPGRKVDPGPKFPWAKINETFTQTNKIQDIISMQSHLERLNFELGEIDGDWGKATQKALDACALEYKVVFTNDTFKNISILRSL